MPTTVKILIVGPVKSGKTAIANYLVDSREFDILQYTPTIVVWDCLGVLMNGACLGVRIIKLESNQFKFTTQQPDAEVELWDCGGDHKYKKCWPALRRNAHGVIIVCRPDIDDGKSLLPWYTEFVENADLDASRVLVLLHCSTELTSDEAIADFKLVGPMEKLSIVLVNIQKEGDGLKLEFESFLSRILTYIHYMRGSE